VTGLTEQVVAPGRSTEPAGLLGRLPVPALLAVSAVLHCFGPAVAVLLFARLDTVGVAWLRIASAAMVFMVYVVLGHRVATIRSSDGSRWSGIDQLGAAMLIAMIVATPSGMHAAVPAFTHPGWLLAGIAVGVCSSVIACVTDQLATARLRRATFALMLSTLPASATVIGLLVLAQPPTARDLIGGGLVTVAVAIHQPPPGRPR
jgi:threonine/homoserine efflux transporter RhtA